MQAENRRRNIADQQKREVIYIEKRLKNRPQKIHALLDEVRPGKPTTEHLADPAGVARESEML